MPSRNPKLIETMVRELAEDVEVAEVAINTGHRVATITHHQANKASVVTVALGNVLHMDKTATTVVRLVTTVDTVIPNKDHQPLAGDHIERCMRLKLMKNTILILSRSSAKCSSAQAVTKNITQLRTT